MFQCVFHHLNLFFRMDINNLDLKYFGIHFKFSENILLFNTVNCI